MKDFVYDVPAGTLIAGHKYTVEELCLEVAEVISKLREKYEVKV